VCKKLKPDEPENKRRENKAELHEATGMDVHAEELSTPPWRLCCPRAGRRRRRERRTKGTARLPEPDSFLH
jgi:hypothetical protein